MKLSARLTLKYDDYHINKSNSYIEWIWHDTKYYSRLSFYDSPLYTFITNGGLYVIRYLLDMDVELSISMHDISTARKWWRTNILELLLETYVNRYGYHHLALRMVSYPSF